MSRADRIVIAGLGNELCADDGVGVVAARRLAAARPDLEVHEVGVAVLSGVEAVAGADTLILLDAIRLGAAPGTLHRLEGPVLGLVVGARDPHGLGLLRALAVSGVAAPRRIVALGVEPALLDYGLALSPAVAAAVDGLLAAVARELAAPALAGAA